MRNLGRLLLLTGLLLGAVPAVGPATAQTRTPESDAVAQEAIGRIRSPFCPGFMLEVCTSPQAAELRDTIRVLAAEGRSADEITEWAFARYGEEWRATPRRSGVGLWAWVIPPLVLLGGAGLVIARLRAARKDAGPPVEAGDPLSEEERSKLAGALQEWERTGEGET